MAAAALLVRPDEPADIAIYALALICFVLIVALLRIAGDQQLLWSEMQLLRRALKNQTLH